MGLRILMGEIVSVGTEAGQVEPVKSFFCCQVDLSLQQKLYVEIISHPFVGRRPGNGFEDSDGRVSVGTEAGQVEPVKRCLAL
ncbi:putative ATP binding protein [Corchorus olitorius]|uniref:ATP binding protein n=1 Tax=Corchorus olitorius TaxID=93759 RepID=A0A1R3KJV3_9ROSI|nr:putative ATP binding protein [Corchorus olitorius]